MMKNRKINSIYFQIWLSEPQSPLLPGETITIYFSHHSFNKTSATLPLQAHLCVGCWGHSRNKWDSFLPLGG